MTAVPPPQPARKTEREKDTMEREKDQLLEREKDQLLEREDKYRNMTEREIKINIQKDRGEKNQIQMSATSKITEKERLF